MPNGISQTLVIKSFETSKDVINSALSDYPVEERGKYQLVETKKGRDGVVIERPLKEATVVSQLKTDWQADKDNVYSLILVRMDNEVVVNFNNYFRMMAGVSQTRANFPISESTTIGMLTDKIKSHLRLPASEQRFGLMGFYGANKDLRKLHKDEKVASLKSAWETPDKTFFQFQVLPEMEDKKHLGADKEGYLEIYYHFPPLWKKRWASLRGNCLFLFKEKGEHDPADQIKSLDEVKVVAVGTAKKKGLGQKNAYRFEIEGGEEIRLLAVEDEKTMTSWVEAIKSCGARNDARAALVATKAPPPQRTFVPIANSTPAAAAGDGAQHASESEDKLLENLKKTADTLLLSRGNLMVAATKALVTESQNFTLAMSKKIDDKTPKQKKEKVEEYINKVKAILKAIIPAAKAVGVLTADVDSSQELKVLKKEVTTLTDACEFILITLRMEEDEIILQDAAPQEELKIGATGNSELDSIVSGLNMFGISPELAEMMKMASSMSTEGDPLAAFAPVPTSTSSSSSKKAAAPVGDDPLDSILAGLNDALDGLDVPLPHASSKNAAADFNWDDTQTEERCALCFGGIQGKVVRGLNRTWHPDCYYCTQCGCDLVNMKPDDVFEGPKGTPYCKKDFLPLCPKCPTCSLPVLPKEIFEAFGKAFHQRCFRCAMCSQSIEGPSFEVENKPYCESCFHQKQGTQCAECYKGIYGNAITVLGKKRHPHCFICTFCKKTLTKETAKAREEKLYCAGCLAQLYG